MENGNGGGSVGGMGRRRSCLGSYAACTNPEPGRLESVHRREELRPQQFFDSGSSPRGNTQRDICERERNRSLVALFLGVFPRFLITPTKNVDDDKKLKIGSIAVYRGGRGV